MIQSLSDLDSDLDAAYQSLIRPDVEQAKLDVMRARSHLFVVRRKMKEWLDGSHASVMEISSGINGRDAINSRG